MSEAVWTVDDIAYDPETHESRAPDGTEIPHVTGILTAVGVKKNFADLASVAPRVRKAVELAAMRGSAVHADCHAYDNDDLDWATVDPRVRPYLDAWVVARERLGLVPVEDGRERRVYHSRLRYTGFLDGIFRFPDGTLGLGDIKTGDPEDSATHLQTVAYLSAWADMHPGGEIPTRRFAVRLQPERKVPFSFIDYTARPDHWLDEARWEACLMVYREQPGRRPRVSVVR